MMEAAEKCVWGIIALQVKEKGNGGYSEGKRLPITDTRHNFTDL